MKFKELFYREKKNENKTKIYILGIPLIKKIKTPEVKKIYVLGIQIFQKFNPIEAKTCPKCEIIEKQILRLEGMKILMERQNITLGDNV